VQCSVLTYYGGAAFSNKISFRCWHGSGASRRNTKKGVVQVTVFSHHLVQNASGPLLASPYTLHWCSCQARSNYTSEDYCLLVCVDVQFGRKRYFRGACCVHHQGDFLMTPSGWRSHLYTRRHENLKSGQMYTYRKLWVMISVHDAIPLFKSRWELHQLLTELKVNCFA
jgi:hypothetical protein